VDVVNNNLFWHRL